jgi:hypothetical protein
MAEESDTVRLPKLDQSLYSEIRTEKFVPILTKFCIYILTSSPASLVHLRQHYSYKQKLNIM